MTEQNLTNSTDIRSNAYILKVINPSETRHVNSLIRRSPSNKLNTLAATPSLPLTTSSTTSLAMYCLDIGSHTQQSLNDTTVSIITTPTDEGRALNDDVKQQESMPDVDICASINDSDNDSFDDEDETTIGESYISAYTIPSNCIIMSCPICLESSSLQSSSCCTFHCCITCWRSHITTTLNDGRIKIPCVSNECNKYLTRETIINFIRIDSVLYERYLKLYTNANQNPRAKTCPRCSHLYSLDTIKSVEIKHKKIKKIPKQIQCSECLLVWCFRCSAPWHENLTCKQFIKGDKLLLKWINQKNEDQWNARKCPKCSSFIQRAGGCPHMTCTSCSCEFCYLCGRRYFKIPVIGQHNNKFSMFGCPYNLHPERPWLRRTIRGMIATSVVVASPIIVVGALTAAVTVLPSVGIYKFVKHVRSRRHGRGLNEHLYRPFVLNQHPDEEHGLLQFGLPVEDVNLEERLRIFRSFQELNHENLNERFPLSIFADMDVENLFSDDDKSPSDFRTCPTTPAINIRKIYSQSLDNLTKINPLPLNRYHSMHIEH